MFVYFCIIVSVAPQISHFAFEDDTANSGDLVSTMCSVHKGDLPVRINWFLNNKTVEDIPGVMVAMVGKKISTLSIDSVQAEHAGTYTCMAKNSAGVASYSAVLNVKGTIFVQVFIYRFPLIFLFPNFFCMIPSLQIHEIYARIHHELFCYSNN